MAEREYIHMRYPYGVPTEMLELPVPEYGNVYEYDNQIVLRHSRNGQAYTYEKDFDKQRVELTFENLDLCAKTNNNFDKKWEVVEFFDKVGAKEFLYADHEGFYWIALVETGSLKFTHTQEKNVSFSLTLEIRNKIAYDRELNDTVRNDFEPLLDLNGNDIFDLNAEQIFTEV